MTLAVSTSCDKHISHMYTHHINTLVDCNQALGKLPAGSYKTYQVDSGRGGGGGWQSSKGKLVSCPKLIFEASFIIKRFQICLEYFAVAVKQ